MSIFGSSISNAEIDHIVGEHFQNYLGSAERVGGRRFAENFDAMLQTLKNWADANNLSMWKRSRIVGTIESTLHSTLPSDVSSELTKKARATIAG